MREVVSFFKAQTLLANAADQTKGKPIANNTRIYKITDDCYSVRLHRTDVIRIYRDGTYRINSGGWQTITTKERINRFSPVSVWQKDYVWYVGGGSGMAIPFEDGMLFDSSGTLIQEAVNV